MRKVNVTGSPPDDWITEALVITQQLIDAENMEARKQIIEDNKTFWRDDRLTDWLLDQFNNKCWYTEAPTDVASFHVDHFRPKGEVKNLDESKELGYWWLAFNWKNYILSGQLINTKKSSYFPLVRGARAPENCPDCDLELETRVLIDPKTNEARLISFEADNSYCIAISAGGISETDIDRVERTIEIYGLNRLKPLNQARRKKWDFCIKRIQKYKAAGESASQVIAEVEKNSVIDSLKEEVSYGAEYSSVAKACIRKNAPEDLVDAVF
ncbi:MAG: hypothetical protein KAJ63_16540 [Methyloprofundus sp.]|nr:hypothetical protein [Methyloprofundus sp.]